MVEREQLIRKIKLKEAVSLGEPTAKFLDTLSFVAGAPYLAVFIVNLIRTMAGDYNIPAIDYLSGSAPWALSKAYEKIYKHYQNLSEIEKATIRKKVSCPPISSFTSAVSKVIDFPITKRKVIYRTRVPLGADLNKN